MLNFGLTTKRLRLPSLTRENAEAQCSGRALPNLAPTRDYEARAFKVGILASGERVDVWALVRLADDAMIGDVGTQRLRSEPDRLCISYQVARSAERQGYATEAVGALLAALAKRPDVRVVEAETLKGRVGSEKVLVRCGFQRVKAGFNGSIWEWRAAGRQPQSAS